MTPPPMGGSPAPGSASAVAGNSTATQGGLAPMLTPASRPGSLASCGGRAAPGPPRGAGWGLRAPAPQMQESRAPHPGFSVPGRRCAECLPWGPPARLCRSADGCRTPALHGLQTRFGRRGPRGEHAGAPRWLQALGQGATCQTRCLLTGLSAGPAAR